MKTIRLTTAQAIVRWLVNQHTEIAGEQVPMFAGAFGIFGHGNVTCLAEALEQVQDDLPTWRGHNEQGMAISAVAYAKAMKRRQIMIAHLVGRARQHQHGDRRGCRPCQPSARASVQRRHLPAPTRRSRPPAGRAVPQSDRNCRRLLQARQPLLGSHHQAPADPPIAPAGACGHARSGRLRTRVLRTPPGRAGRGIRLPGRLLRADGPLHPEARTRPPGHRSCSGRAGRRREAADHRWRRCELLGGDRSPHRLRRAPRYSGRRDRRRQIDSCARPPQPRGRNRREWRHVGQCGRRGCRRDPRDRHPATGLHDGFMGAVQEPTRPVRVDQPRPAGTP